MKPLLLPQTGSKIIFYGAIYFALCLPFQTDWFPPLFGIAAMGFGWLFSANLLNRLKAFLRNAPALLVSGLFLIPLLWMPLSDHPDEGWQKVVLSIALIVFPLIFSSLPQGLDKKRRDTILTAFIASCALSGLFLIANSLWHLGQEGVLLTHQDFTTQPRISIHYFALYQVFALFVLLHFSFQRWASKSGLWKLGVLVVCLILGTAIFLAAARLQLLLLIVGVVLLFFHHLQARFGFLKTALLQLLIMMGILAAALIIPGSRQRVTDAYREVIAIQDPDSKYQTNHRYYIWKNAFKVIGNNWITGTGTGSADPALNQYLENEEARFWLHKHEYYTLGEKDYNYHNSYLQHLAAYGIFGLLILVAAFWMGFRQNAGSLPLVFFLTFSLFSFITESMLERQAGVYFFSFFYGFLVVRGSPTSGKA